MNTMLRNYLATVSLGCLLALAARGQTTAPAAAKAPPPPDLASNPAADRGTIDPALPTIFVASDSTAARGKGESQQGWAVPFADYFDPAKVNVVNRARGGRSSRTFISEGLWDQLLADVKAGDIVLIQFGHNDGGAINEEPPGSKRPLRARASLPGLGEESQEIDNVVTKKHEVVHTFGWYMRKMIADTKAKGATPIVLSLTVRNVWPEGKLERGSGEYGAWSAQIAKAAGVAFIDLTNLVADKLEPLGPAKVKEIFQQDYVHFNLVGADLHAANVVAGLKALRSSRVARYLSAKGADVAAAPATAVVEAARPMMRMPEPADPKLPTLWLIGDSTVRNGRGDGAGGLWGWGDEVGVYFDPAKLNVVNRAVGGLSSRTYLTGGLWDRVLATVKPGDFVMMQFGHNDSSPINEAESVPPQARRARGTIKGVGEETQEIENILTKKHEVVHSYGWYLRKFIADIRAKGATPIVCSLIPRKGWTDGKANRNRDDYAGWAAGVARTEGVGFVDLNEIIARKYDELGADKVEPLFGATEHTHTSLIGAELNARCVVAGLKALAPDPLAPFLSAKATDVAPVDLSQPASTPAASAAK
jgi:lysophospholipase L1-like esterase